MAHWGRALGMLDNPFLWPGSLPPKVWATAAAIDAARAAGLKTQREKDYVEALAVFFKDNDKLNHRTRAKRSRRRWEAGRPLPDDTEATILYALVLSANFDPADKNYANQLKAAAMLEPLFAEQPDHPGVAHYLIHSYDYPPIAPQGLAAAKRYAKIAPDAPARAAHALAHLHARRPLAGLDRVQPRVGQGRRRRHSMRTTRTTTWSTRSCSSRRTRPPARCWRSRAA